VNKLPIFTTMPNQRSTLKQSVTIALPRDLVEKIDGIAARERLSRTWVIERILRERIDHYLRFSPVTTVAEEDRSGPLSR
jgi:hypothetical protein